MRKIIQTSLAAALVVGALGAGTASAQAGFLSSIVRELTADDTIISDPSDNPEVQAEKDYYDSAEQDEIDYLNRDAQAEIDYYNSFNQ